MPYVMVPVPEEYVTEVMQLVVDMTRQGTTDPGTEPRAAELAENEAESSSLGSTGG